MAGSSCSGTTGAPEESSVGTKQLPLQREGPLGLIIPTINPKKGLLEGVIGHRAFLRGCRGYKGPAVSGL